MRNYFALALAVVVITSASAQVPKGASTVQNPRQGAISAANQVLTKDGVQDANIVDLQEQINRLQQQIIQLQNQPRGSVTGPVALTPDNEWPKAPAKADGELQASVENLWTAIGLIKADLKRLNQR
jgi:hypothetical protein